MAAGVAAITLGRFRRAGGAVLGFPLHALRRQDVRQSPIAGIPSGQSELVLARVIPLTFNRARNLALRIMFAAALVLLFQLGHYHHA
jgi:hypothetical protein